jgi:pimeloyl-ACP methyl ester carboxylesterase
MLMGDNVLHSDPAIAKANGIEIAYDTFGDSSAPPLLLIMGLGFQMIMWEDELCAQLSARGYWVIRFDNRDMGLTTKFHEAGVPKIRALMEAKARGEVAHVPYTLNDMAEHAIGLLDAMDIESAHVVGLSMGGMLGQLMAVNHPKRVRTLTSIMSSTGDPGLPPPQTEAMSILLTPLPKDRAGYIESSVQMWRVLSGPGFPIDEARIRGLAGQAYDRDFNPPGFARQLAAITVSGSRKEALKSLTIPTLIIHGDADPLASVEGGIDTANTIPGSKLLIIEGMGHDLHPALWAQVIDAISDHTE